MRAAVLVILLIPAAAFAQAMANDTEAAKAHFAAGSAYYEQGNYQDAVREFSEAYRLSARPDLLYNLALCYEKLKRWDPAIEALRRYLIERPDAQDRALIQARLASLERRRADDRGDERPPPNAPSAPRLAAPAPKPRHVASLVVGGLGLAMLASSIGTGVAALQLDSDLRARCMNGTCATSDRDEAERGRALAISTDVLIGVGAAAVVVGVVLFVVEHKRGTQKSARLDGISIRF